MEEENFGFGGGGHIDGFADYDPSSSISGKKRKRVEFTDDTAAAVPESAGDGKSTSNKSKSKSKGGGFQSMGLSPEVLNGVLRMGYKVPTPIQRKVLPLALSGRDVVAMARTGSGKTAAFLIPLVEKLKTHSMRIGARAVILSPTRELALQTLKFGKGLAKFTDLRFTAIVGGESMEEQFAALAKNPDVLIATPGRLCHLLLEVPGFHLKGTEYIVFDEADRLFEMGFADQIKDIMEKMPERRQTVLVSATLPKVLVQFAKAGLKDPELIRLDTDTKVSENLKLAFFTGRKEEKMASLVWIAKALIPDDQQAMVFVATRYHADLLSELLRAVGLAADPIYGQMDQTARLSNLAKFRARKTRFLIVTDVAARGLDLPLLDNVINYDFPDKPKLFVHRVGRVARQGRSGTAISLVVSSDLPYMLDLLLFLGRPATNLYEKNPEGYTMEEMQPSQVHYGQIPRSAIENDLEKTRQLVADSTDMAALAKSCDNAMEQYNKSKTEASRTSVARARELPDDRIHPLLISFSMAREATLRNFISGLQAFRPTQTVMELDPVTFKHAGAILAAKRQVHRHALAPRVGAVSISAVSAAAARGTLDWSEFGDAVIEKLAAAKARREVEEEEDSDDDAHMPNGAEALFSSMHGGSPANETVRKVRLSAAARRKQKRGEAFESVSEVSRLKEKVKQTVREKGLEAAAEVIRDTAHYLTHAPAHDRVVEAAYSAAGTIAASEAPLMGGDTVASDLAGITKFDDNAFDILGDEKTDFSKARRVRYWDSQKRKYLWVSSQELDKQGRRKKPSVRNEAGAFVDRQQMSKKHEYGEQYRRWVRSARQQVEGGGEESRDNTVSFGDGDDGGADEPPAPKRARKGDSDGTAGRHVQEELRTAGQIRKERMRKAKSQGKFHKFKSGSDSKAKPTKGAAPPRSRSIGGSRGRGGGRGGRGRGGGRGGGRR